MTVIVNWKDHTGTIHETPLPDEMQANVFVTGIQADTTGHQFDCITHPGQ